MNFLVLAGEIRQLCAGGASGTLFVTTEDNHSVRIVVEAGNIVSLVAGRLKGAAVIARLKAAGVLRYRFQRDMLMRTPGDHGVPLEALGEDVAAPPPEVVEPDLSEIIEIICREAVDCIGPMANMICTDYLQDVSTMEGIRAAIAAISDEIGEEALVREFQNRAKACLGEREI